MHKYGILKTFIFLLNSTYPSTKFSCVFQIHLHISGLYPSFHGQVHNYMWDPLTDKQFLNGQNYPEANQPYWWNGAEPIWITAKKQVG